MKPSRHTTSARLALLIACAAALLGLAGCQRSAERTSAERAAAAPTSQPVAQKSPRGMDHPTVSAGGQTGAVPKDTATSADARQRARPEDARAMGGPPADGTRAMGASRDAIDDASITRSVNAALAADHELRAAKTKVDVDTQNGIVTLSGPVPTATAKEHASEVARGVHGVVSVNNQLTLKNG